MDDADGCLVLSYIVNGLNRFTVLTVEEFSGFEKDGCLGEILVGRCKGLMSAALDSGQAC